MNGNKLGKLRERLKKINQKSKTPSRVTETPLQKTKKVEYERFGVPINKSVNQVKEYQKLEKLENEKKEKIEKQLEKSAPSQIPNITHKKGIPKQKQSTTSSNFSKTEDLQKKQKHNDTSPEKNKPQELNITPPPVLPEANSITEEQKKNNSTTRKRKTIK